MQGANDMIKLDVRGKRKRREPRKSSSSLSRSPKPRGRPMKSASELKAKKPMIAFPDSASPAKTQSWLERLPAELIEQIFLQALEVNMAKASFFLGRTLSKESIYRTLILFAFFKDDEQHPVETRHFAPAVYRLLSQEEKFRLQQGILDCRWCTMIRIWQCLPTLERLLFSQQWYRVTGNEQAAKQQDESQAEQPPSKPYSLEDYVRERVEKCNGFRFKASVLPQTAYKHLEMPPKRLIPGTLAVHYLPNRLLNPKSWRNSTNSSNPNPNPVDFLQLLFMGWLWFFPQRQVPFKAGGTSAFTHGFETAIRERDRDTLEFLLHIHDSFYSSFHPCVSKLEVGEGPADLGSVLPLATRQEEDSSWILALLVGRRLADAVLQRYDKVLTKWAIDKTQEGDDFAKTLLDRMAAK